MEKNRTQKELAEMLSNKAYKPTRIASNSQFYMQIMEDGNIFNPYIHRRFLPARYLSAYIGFLGRSPYFNGGWEEFASIRFGIHYNRAALDKLLNEVRTLSIIEGKDSIAFGERSLFFPLEDLKENLAKVAVDAMNSNFIYYFNADTIGQFVDEVKVSNDYKELYNTMLSYLRFLRRLVRTTNVDNFMNWYKDRFILAGAYYTLKHQIMFEGNVSVEGNNSVERCSNILKALEDGAGYGYFHNLINI